MQLEKYRNKLALLLRIAAFGLCVAILVLLFLPSGEAVPAVHIAEKKGAEIPQATSVPTATPDPNKKLIALTFDDGPMPGSTDRILATLKKYNARATFFIVGREVRGSGELLRQIVAQGSEIGNHTWEHKGLIQYSASGLRKTLQRTTELVKKETQADVKLVRPTYGEVNKKVEKNVQYPLIYWNVDTDDWETKNVGKITKKIYGKVKDGDIVLLHDLYKTTADAAEKIIPYLVNKGFELVTVSELMQRRGITMKAGKVYYSAR